MFDFASYLVQLFPQCAGKITIHPLSGGLTNLTARATFASPGVYLHSHHFQSVILKYAPPFVAATPTQPMSVYRQTIEARALAILNGIDPHKLYPNIPILLDRSTIRIPKLIYHDDKHNVLWISDLGNTKTLSEYLIREHDDRVGEIGAQLGRFLAEFYRATQKPSGEAIAFVTNPSAAKDTHEFLTSLTKTALVHAEVQDAEILAERVRRALQDHNPDESCLGMVDMWPESVLVDADGHCGLVDWEYFGRSDAASEIGMLLAHLHIIVLNNQASQRAKERTRIFITHLLRSYVDHSPPLSNYGKRKLLTSHGRELINGIELYSAKLNDASRTRILQAGVNSLRAAGDTVQLVDLSIIKENDETAIWEDFTSLQFIV